MERLRILREWKNLRWKTKSGAFVVLFVSIWLAMVAIHLRWQVYGLMLERARIEDAIVISQVKSLIKTNRGNGRRVAQMLVLFESPAGFAMFQLLDERKLEKVEDLWKEFETQDSARKVVKLKAFSKFANAAEALGPATSIVDSKFRKGLRNFLKSNCEGETLAVADSKLGNIIQEKLAIDCVNNNSVVELMRGLHSLAGELISGLEECQMAPMSLGLSHGLSRHELKFSPDKVDTLMVQAIQLLDDIDKELNIYAMTVREWYGWHFPELLKIIQNKNQYAKFVSWLVAELRFPSSTILLFWQNR